MPPGPIKYIFLFLFKLEAYLKETPEERKKRQQEQRDKILGARDPRFSILYTLPKTKEDAQEYIKVLKVAAMEEIGRRKVL